MAIPLERNRPAATRARALRLGLGIPVSLWPLALLLVLYSWQLWVEVAGFTIRAEDLLILTMLAGWLLPMFLRLKLRYRRNLLYGPLLLWMGAIALAVLLTLAQPYDSVTKKDAVVNGSRLILAMSTFFLVFSHPAPARDKIRTVFLVTILFSFVTTAVSLLQIGHWDGWLPFSLPAILTEKAPGANMAKGREIFGLFVGDTSGHAWAAMLALQGLTVFLYARSLRSAARRWLWFGYFGLITLILLRTAVRNALFGLAASLIVVTGLHMLRSRFPFNRIAKPLLLVVGILLLLQLTFWLAPDSYYVQRAQAAIPQLNQAKVVVSTASSIYGRIEFAQIAITLFLKRPLLGHGFYSYQALSTTYRSTIIVHAHNSYLQILAEMGLLGMAAFAWLAWRLVRFLQWLWLRSISDVVIARGRDLLIATAIFLALTSLFSNPMGQPRQIGFFAIQLGCLASYGYEVMTRGARHAG